LKYSAADIRAQIAKVRGVVGAANAFVPPEIEPPKIVPPQEIKSAPAFKSLRKWHEMMDGPYGSLAVYYEEREYPAGTSGSRLQL
jgi:hypothetical protein